MGVTTHTIGKCAVLDCSGNVVLGPSTEALRKAIHQAAQEGTSKVVVNLGDVSSIDSSGLGELISGYVHVKNNGGKLVLLRATKKLQKLIELTKTDVLFEFFDDEQKALEGCE
jgi:anti-sigma B factor antagonist